MEIAVVAASVVGFEIVLVANEKTVRKGSIPMQHTNKRNLRVELGVVGTATEVPIGIPPMETFNADGILVVVAGAAKVNPPLIESVVVVAVVAGAPKLN